MMVWRVTVGVLAVAVIVSLVMLLGGNRPIGSENLVNRPLPDFAAPLASGSRSGDSNIYTAEEARAAGSRAACEVKLPGVFNSCRDLGEKAIVTFWNSTKPECVAHVETLDRFVRTQEGLSSAAVAFDEPEREVRVFLRTRNWRLAVPIDRDGAAAGRYAVAVCPTTFFVRGGRVVVVKLGRLTGEQFKQGLAAPATGTGGN
jgi:hypothetical protein